MKALRLTVALLLAASFLVLMVGTAWHVHHQHCHTGDFCFWCLALASVLVLAIVFGVASAAHKTTFLIPPPISFLSAGRQVAPLGYRAPPASGIDTV